MGDSGNCLDTLIAVAQLVIERQIGYHDPPCGDKACLGCLARGAVAEVAKHGPRLEDLTKDERSLLLFLETQAVDHQGIVDVAHMNREDFRIAERWDEEGLIQFGRVASDYISKSPPRGRMQPTHWVKLSDGAFALAHAERKARSERVWAKRLWKTAAEANAGG